MPLKVKPVGPIDLVGSQSVSKLLHEFIGSIQFRSPNMHFAILKR
jgi:hypothetical protein